MKYAVVRPLFKKGDRADRKIYRPVSLLTSFSKVLEKLALMSLQRFLEGKEILCDQQHGFRKNRSTATAMPQLVNAVGQAMERKTMVAAILCDLSKAFDTMDHTLLVEKVIRFGADGVAADWVASYLANRKQRVQLENGVGMSEWAPINQGVQQGSILGPALFNIYVNDLASSLSAYGTKVQFSDDTTIVVEAENAYELGSKVNGPWTS
jgi:Reverse transcriptase (RNA-dependent DNA polymerase)